MTAREPAGCSALEAARTAWEESGRQAAGNGAVMRCAPLAIRWMDDDTALVRNTVASAAATHYDPRCIWSAVLVNLAVASLVRGTAVDPGELAARAAGAARELGAALAPFGLEGAGLQLPAEVAGALSGLPPAAPEEIGFDGAAMDYTLKAMQRAPGGVRQFRSRDVSARLRDRGGPRTVAPWLSPGTPSGRPVPTPRPRRRSRSSPAARRSICRQTSSNAATSGWSIGTALPKPPGSANRPAPTTSGPPAA